MAVFTAVVLTTFLLEDDDFVILLLVDNGGCYRGARNCRGADLGGARFADQQNVIQRDGAVLGCVELLDFNNVVLLDAILLTTGFNDCVHDSYFRMFFMTAS